MVRLALFILLAGWTARAAEPVLLVLLKGGHALAYYTMEGKLLGKVPVGQHPHEMALSPDSRYAYITDNGTMRIEQAGEGGNTISVVDLAARRRIDTIPLGKFRRPHGIAYDARRNYLAVTTEAPDQLILIDAARRSVLRTFATGGVTSHMVAFGKDIRGGAEYAFVSNSNSANVTAIHLTTGARKAIPTGTRPEGSVRSPDGNFLFVCNRESASLTVIDIERQAALSEIRTGRGPVRVAMTPDGRTLVYGLMHDQRIGLADVETRREVAQIGLDGSPVSLNLSPDGRYAFASAQDQDTVYIVSVPERKLVRQFTVEKGAAPDPVLMVTLP